MVELSATSSDSRSGDNSHAEVSRGGTSPTTAVGADAVRRGALAGDAGDVRAYVATALPAAALSEASASPAGTLAQMALAAGHAGKTHGTAIRCC
jgi:hypothetical protein